MSGVADLIGKTLVRVERQGDDAIEFQDADGTLYRMWHSQHCCENVTVDDIAGDLNDLVGTPILKAEESTSETTPEGLEARGGESETWTFYHLATINGYVTIRWYGESNGYYSESVDFDTFEPAVV
jgi:hypothetical protein